MRCGLHKRAVARFAPRNGMNDYTLFDAALRGRDAPLVRRSVDDHQARHRAHFAEAFPFGGCGGAAPRHLQAEDGVIVGRIHRGSFDFDL